MVGIIGQNGAGKSTLLKHLAHVTNPTSGEVVVRGSVAPLIEVGAGVNPELSGRENIYLNGAILGIPKKTIEEKIDDIIEFSELEQFVDTPVKRYSSGMTVKLGFSIATSLDADILIVDEVLAVGDLAFQRKCFDRMEDLIRRSGKTVLLVSHNIRQVERLCNRVILLDHGRIAMDDVPAKVCHRYYQLSNESIYRTAIKAQASRTAVDSSGEIDIRSISVRNSECDREGAIVSGSALEIEVQLRVNNYLEQPEIVIGTHTTDFVYLTANSNASLQCLPNLYVGENTVVCRIPSYPLAPGVYCIRVAIFDKNRRRIFMGESLKIFNVLPAATEAKQAPMRLIEVEAQWEISSVGIDS